MEGKGTEVKWTWFLLFVCQIALGVATSKSETDDKSTMDSPWKALALHVTSGKNMATQSEYWTSYLNVSYLDKGENKWHTDRTETGRYGKGVVKDVAGLAVELISYHPFKSRDDFNKTYKKHLEREYHYYSKHRSTGCMPPFEENYPTDGSPWIAVIRRGSCTFNKKIMNALKLNASGVLVYDNEKGGVLQSMVVDDNLIPAVFTYDWKGKEILEVMRKYGNVHLSLYKASRCRTKQISSPTDAREKHRILYCIPPDEWEEFQSIILKTHGQFGSGWTWNITSAIIPGSGVYSVEKRTSVLFVSVSFLILVLISLAWLIFYYVQRFRYYHAKDLMERQLCSQAKQALAIISTTVLQQEDLDRRNFSDTCAVCIETYCVDEVVRILPCKHQFHKSCIDQWLLEKRTCPMCKMDILKHYGLVEPDQDSEDNSEAAAAVQTNQTVGTHQMLVPNSQMV